MTQPDVLVVGGGIIGAAVARALALDGLTVSVLDSGREAGIATQASGGMLAPLAEAHEGDPLIGIGIRGRDLCRQLAPALAEETGVDIGLWQDGVLKVAFTEEEESQARGLVAWHRQQGLNSEWITAGELLHRCSGINPEARGALLAPEDGALEPLAFLEALLVSGARRGVRLARGERAVGIEIRDRRVSGIRTESQTFPAGAIVIAAGAWSGRLEGLPRPLSVEPVRGQMLAYPWPEGEPSAIAYTGRGYVLRRGNEAIAGSTMEYVGFDAAVTPDGRDRVARTAATVYPALAHAAIQRSWAGFRPGTPDGQPIVGADPEVPNLWYATGHGRNGILLASVTGEIIAHLVRGDPSDGLEIDLAPISPNRFWNF
ncbi:MAG: glycine oxidase ThiO [Gemmatimonadota bacterium]|nr:glycine oxidase ThiO [Gemmatimonadota bacterium]